MAKGNRSRVPEGESRQDKFRRVLNERLKPLVKRFDQITSMPLQPSYDISEDDIKHVLAEVKERYDAFVDTYEKALAGILKAKEIKDYTGIDWDKELQDESDEE